MSDYPLITTFVPSSESLDMRRRTLAGMIVADCPHETWVLDEGSDPAARAMCEHLGVRHFSRKGREGFNTDGGTFAAKTKGGNHHAWYAHHGGDCDVVAQIYSDFRVRRDFLRALSSRRMTLLIGASHVVPWRDLLIWYGPLVAWSRSRSCPSTSWPSWE